MAGDGSPGKGYDAILVKFGKASHQHYRLKLKKSLHPITLLISTADRCHFVLTTSPPYLGLPFLAGTLNSYTWTPKYSEVA